MNITKEQWQKIADIVLKAAFAILVVLGLWRDAVIVEQPEARAVRERIAIYAKEDSWIVNGFDLLFYSDDRATQTYSIDGATGNVSNSGTFTVGSDGSGADVTFYSATAGDLLLWDASEEGLYITGTAAQDALDIVDGNVDIDDDIDVNGTSNLDDVDIDLSASMNVDGHMVDIGTCTTPGTADGDNDLCVAEDAEVDDTLDVDGDIDLDGDGFDVDITAGFSIDGDSGSNASTSSGDLTLEAETGSVTIKGDEADAAAIYLDANEAVTTGVDIDVGSVSGLTIDGGLTDIGGGTCGVADGDNDVCIAAVLEVDGETELDGALDADSTSDFADTATFSKGSGQAMLLSAGGTFSAAATADIYGYGYVAVGDGTPDGSVTAGNDEELYVEGEFEVDGEAEFDGAIDADSTMDVAGNVNLQSNLTVDDLFNIDDTAYTSTGAQTITPTVSYYDLNPGGQLTITLAASCTAGDLYWFANRANQTVTFVDTNIRTTDGNAVSMNQYDTVSWMCIAGTEYYLLFNSANQ